MEVAFSKEIVVIRYFDYVQISSRIIIIIIIPSSSLLKLFSSLMPKLSGCVEAYTKSTTLSRIHCIYLFIYFANILVHYLLGR